jgi:lipid-binding SYLF domain-containing protein
MKKLLFGLVLLALAVVFAGCRHQVRNSPNQTAATSSNPGPKGDRPEVMDRLNDSGKVLDELMNTPDNSVPETILAKARCVAVIPSMVKGGFVVGGRHGRGVATCRTGHGWSAPAFLTISGGSWGAQIGVAEVDLVLLFMNENGVNSLLKNNFKIGADASLAAGPIGREAEASTDAKLNSEILAYSRAKGLFAGLELSGAAVRPDEDSNTAFYGHNVNWRETLSGSVTPPAGANPFLESVRKNFREARTNQGQ